MLGLASKKDFRLVSIVGISFGIAVLVTLENIKPPHWELTFASAALIILGFLIFANIAIGTAGLLGVRRPSLWQFAKYGASGSLSAAIDIGILNFLSLVFQIFAGPLIIVFNVIALATATTNAYLWNKIWTFKKNAEEIFAIKEYLKFLAATSGSLIISTALVYFLTTVIGAPNDITPEAWENISKLISVPIVMTWNFIAYKFFVFKQSS